jgi:hypothetical protein
LPEAFDGDDLSVHLMYQVINPIVEDNTDTLDSNTSKDKGLPAISLIATLAIIIAAVRSRNY